MYSTQQAPIYTIILSLSSFAEVAKLSFLTRSKPRQKTRLFAGTTKGRVNEPSKHFPKGGRRVRFTSSFCFPPGFCQPKARIRLVSKSFKLSQQVARYCSASCYCWTLFFHSSLSCFCFSSSFHWRQLQCRLCTHSRPSRGLRVLV